MDTEMLATIANLLQDEEAKALIRKMILVDEPSAHPVFVWCVELVDANTGVQYYHPVVMPNAQNVRQITPELFEQMNTPAFYQMVYSKNQFEAHRYANQMRMIESMTGNHTHLISIPQDVFEQLQNNLTELVSKILAEAQKCYEPIDNISALARIDATTQKANLLIGIFNQIETLYSCVNQQMEISDSKEHEYIKSYDDVDEDEDEFDEDDCDYDDEY